MGKKKVNIVTVRWHDGYLEKFPATEVRFGCDLLFMRLEDGNNRQIPLRSVRWFGMDQESHQNQPKLTKKKNGGKHHDRKFKNHNK